jgi:uncharacterized protein (DUF1810 family)
MSLLSSMVFGYDALEWLERPSKSLRAMLDTCIARAPVSVNPLEVLILRDPYNLKRFLRAQEPIFEHVIFELRSGQKTGHWMWYIFPQIHGLGSSSMAREFEISSLAEAEGYLQHRSLGPRLLQCSQLVVDAGAGSISEIFHYPDDLKFRSSMTLFLRADPTARVFQQALDMYFAGELDPRTLEKLEQEVQP